MIRIIATGSRYWRDEASIKDGLDLAARSVGVVDGSTDVTLVTGAQVSTESGEKFGADHLAERVARRYGWEIERHPADWDTYGLSAGPRRNRQMVEAGADVCAAFLALGMPCLGTKGCMKLCMEASIPVLVIARKVMQP